jgi:hypothetical protein
MQSFLPRKELNYMLLKLEKSHYSEQEAAEILGISVERLHFLLDRNIFNDGSLKPMTLNFLPTDLLMIGFWDKNTPIETKMFPMTRTRTAFRRH